MIVLIVAILGLGFGIVNLVALPFGGISLDLAIFYGIVLVVVAIGVLAYFGRRRQKRAQAERSEQIAPAHALSRALNQGSIAGRSMCGRYTLATPIPAAIRARFPIGETVEVRRRYNVAPGDEVLAVTTDREGAPRGELLRWGLVPSWAKSPDTGLKMINARVETVAERPAFRRAFERFRCLIVADGFYEWRRSRRAQAAVSHNARRRRPVRVRRPVVDLARRGRNKLRTCTILTTAANSAIAALHDRMPVILAPEAERAGSTPPPRATALARSCPVCPPGRPPCRGLPRRQRRALRRPGVPRAALLGAQEALF